MSLLVHVGLMLLSNVLALDAQELRSLPALEPVPPWPGSEAPGWDSMIRLPEIHDSPSESWIGSVESGMIDEGVPIEWMRPPQETSSRALSQGEMPIRPISFHVGSIEVIPYGVLWSDMIYTTSRQVPRRFILWIESEELQGEDAFEVETRYTRMGVKLKGPCIDLMGGLNTGGQVEVDFLGGFLTENQPDTRLRHAYWEAKNEAMRFLVGQYWDLTSPLLPNTVNFSVGWAAGNIGFRRTQFRVERYLHLSDDVVLSLEGAAATEVIQDFVGSTEIVAESPNWPMLQARSALTLGHGSDRPVTIGVSGHAGETGFDFRQGHPANPALTPQDDARYTTWSFNADVRVPVTDRLGFHGEFFTGANLSPLLGGISQGVCPCLRVPIRSIGGWGEIWYDVSSCVHAHVGFGIDDPRDADSLIGRTYNRMIYANVFLDLTEQLVTGLEVSSWRTGYHNRTGEPGFIPIAGPTAPGEAIAIDWTVRYKF